MSRRDLDLLNLSRATPPAEVIMHFDANGTLPSTFTLELRKGRVATLPLANKRDFDEAKKGFIAEPSEKEAV